MKKRAKLITGLALAGLLTVGGTFAYLQYQTGTKENTFTFGDNVKGDIEEPKWDGECSPMDTTCETDPDKKDPNNPGGDKENAKEFYPGQVLNKNPMLVNGSDEVSAYVGVAIDFNLLNDGEATLTSFEELANFVEVDWNTEYWYFNADHTYAVYKGELSPKEVTEPVFRTVKIKESATYPGQALSAEEAKKGEIAARPTDMKNFRIDVTGYFAQVDGMTKGEVDALQTVFENKFTGEFINLL